MGGDLTDETAIIYKSFRALKLLGSLKTNTIFCEKAIVSFQSLVYYINNTFRF